MTTNPKVQQYVPCIWYPYNGVVTEPRHVLRSGLTFTYDLDPVTLVPLSTYIYDLDLVTSVLRLGPKLFSSAYIQTATFSSLQLDLESLSSIDIYD